MANQDPQPEVYSTTHTFAGAAVAGTSNVVSIFTNQANNEEVRLYAIGVEMLDATTGAVLAAGLDYSVSIQVGPNNVPSNAFSAGYINSKNDRTLAFSSPILCLFQQPLQITVVGWLVTVVCQSFSFTVPMLLLNRESFTDRPLNF